MQSSRRPPRPIRAWLLRCAALAAAVAVAGCVVAPAYGPYPYYYRPRPYYYVPY